MIRRPALRTLVLGALASTFALIGTALADETFDPSPEQAGRVHAERNESAIAAIAKDFTFVTSGKFTVAVSPGGPPLATYAKILARWHLSEEALSKSETNPRGLPKS